MNSSLNWLKTSSTLKTNRERTALMGDYQVACAITKAPIEEGDRVGFVLLQKQPMYSGMPEDTGRQVIFHSTDDYFPYLPPVFGEYDDYGSIINTTPSQTTAFLEKRFNKSISEVLKNVGNDDDEEGDAKLGGMSRMMFLEDAIPAILPHVEEDLFYERKGGDAHFLEIWDDFLNSFNPEFVPPKREGSYMNPEMFVALYSSVDEKTGKRQFASAWDLPVNKFLRDHVGLMPEEYDLLHLYENGEEFLVLRHLLRVALGTNTIFAPNKYSINGADGVDGLLASYEFAAALLKKREAEMDAWDDEEES
jgi:hypothetical protein